MERAVWLIIMIPLAAFFTGIGIFAWRRKKPMWFWSGSEVKEREIRDVAAYNRANGIMWLAFSGVFWVSAILGAFSVETAGPVLGVGVIAGIPALIVAYTRIYKKYKRK
ncbi:MAG: hypothetical protein IKW79_02630 [Schwartzia sp.]|nr:hypothetical protein [Schwartzia sp. (in: firmicutes)]